MDTSMLFLLGTGLFLVVVGLAIASVAFVLRRSIEKVRRPWHKDAHIIQYIGMICLLLMTICVALFLLKIVEVGFIAFLAFLILPLLYLGLGIYGLVLARRKKVMQ